VAPPARRSVAGPGTAKKQLRPRVPSRNLFLSPAVQVPATSLACSYWALILVQGSGSQGASPLHFSRVVMECGTGKHFKLQASEGLSAVDIHGSRGSFLGAHSNDAPSRGPEFPFDPLYGPLPWTALVSRHPLPPHPSPGTHPGSSPRLLFPVLANNILLASPSESNGATDFQSRSLGRRTRPVFTLPLPRVPHYRSIHTSSVPFVAPGKGVTEAVVPSRYTHRPLQPSTPTTEECLPQTRVADSQYVPLSRFSSVKAKKSLSQCTLIARSA